MAKGDCVNDIDPRAVISQQLDLTEFLLQKYLCALEAYRDLVASDVDGSVSKSEIDFYKRNYIDARNEYNGLTNALVHNLLNHRDLFGL